MKQQLTPAETLIAHRCGWSKVETRKWVPAESDWRGRWEYGKKLASPSAIRSKIARREHTLAVDFPYLKEMIAQMDKGFADSNAAERVRFLIEVARNLRSWETMKERVLLVEFTKLEAQGKSEKEIEALILAESL